MAYIYQYDKRHDVTYVYEKVQKINPETGLPVSGRKIVGRLDKSTNAIVPTGPRGRKPKKPKDTTLEPQATIDYARYYKETNIELKKTQQLLQESNKKVDSLETKLVYVRNILKDSINALEE